MAEGNKTFKLTSSKNFDVLLKAYGLSEEAIKKVESTQESINVAKDGDNFTLTREIAGNVIVNKFKLGEEFDDTRADGAKVKALVTAEGRGFRYVRKSDDGKGNVTIMKFEGDTLSTTTTLDGTDIVATRTYEA